MGVVIPPLSFHSFFLTSPFCLLPSERLHSATVPRCSGLRSNSPRETQHSSDSNPKKIVQIYTTIATHNFLFAIIAICTRYMVLLLDHYNTYYYQVFQVLWLLNNLPARSYTEVAPCNACNPKQPLHV